MPALFTDPRIRTLFSSVVLENLDAAHVYTNGFNQNYAGELRGKGSTLRIFSFPRPTINDYTAPTADLSGVNITYERLSPSSQELTIDQDSDWAIAEERVQDMLANPKAFAELAKNAAWAMADKVDRHLAATLQNGSGNSDPISGNGTTSAPIVGNGASDDITAYGLTEQLVEQMKVKNIPGSDLHLFVPMWFMTMIRTDLRFTGFGTPDSRRTARGEQIVELAGVTIHETINSLAGNGTSFSTGVDGSSQNRLLMTWRGAATYVPYIDPEGMVDTISAASNPLSHDNLMRARALWGAKVTIADGVITQLIQKGSYEA